MNLIRNYSEPISEEDVNDACIKAFGLKGYSKNLIDIQTLLLVLLAYSIWLLV